MPGRDRPPSIIANGLAITGNLVSDGEIQIDGSIAGDVSGRRVTLGEHAQVRGEITADAVLIRGEVQGRIRATSVDLARTARVKGDIWHAKLAIESGAHLDGLCKHMDNPRESEAAPLPALAAPAETRLIEVAKEPAKSETPATANGETAAAAE